MIQNNSMKKKKKIKRKIFVKESNNRINAIIVFTILAFLIILVRITYLNIFMGNYYNMILNKNIKRQVYGESVPRGRILDRNGKVLVDNRPIKTIYYKKADNITNKEEISLAYQASKIINLDYNNVKDRNLREFYILINEKETNKLITDKEYEKLDNRQISSNQIYELKIKRIKNEKINKMSSEDKKAAYMYYLMNKGYS